MNKRLFSYINLLQATNGTKMKQKILSDNADNKEFCKFLYYALNPLITYNMSETTIRQQIPGAWQTHGFKDIFDICETLSSKKGVDDHTVNMVCSFLRTIDNDEEREIYIKLLAKTLRLGITAKTVNKIIPGLIPEWEVQQAYSVEKYPPKAGEEFWLTEKLNGVRATFYNGKLIARSGAPYSGLDHIIKEIESSPMGAYVLDGELTLKNKGSLSDNEAFRIATGILNSDDVNKTAICYTVFDILPEEEFDCESPTIGYKDRRSLLDAISTAYTSSDYVKILPVLYHGTDLFKIDVLLEQMVSEDKEGLMLNTDVPYKRTRHKGILKIKRFYTMDLTVVGYEEGSGRLDGTLGALLVEYKGNIVKVGSGFTDEQRKEYWEGREDIVGMLCEVKYKEISTDKNTGLESLQFPVFVRLRNDKSEVSFE